MNIVQDPDDLGDHCDGDKGIPNRVAKRHHAAIRERATCIDIGKNFDIRLIFVYS